MGVSLFEFPLHSHCASVHDTLTGVQGTFQKVMTSIKTVTNLKAEICAVIVLTKINVKAIKTTLKLAQDLGIQRVMIARFNLGGRGIKNTDRLLPRLSEIRNAFSIVNAYTQTHTLKITANVCIPYCIINPQDYSYIPISSCSADLQKMPLTIDNKGNIRMCNHSPQIIGNLFKNSLDSIMKSEYVKKWKNACPQYCLDCIH